MMAVGGARDAMRSDYSYNKFKGKNLTHNNFSFIKIPSSTTITYEGILNATYFKLNSKEEKKTMNMEISLASVKNPLSNEKEVWLGTL